MDMGACNRNAGAWADADVHAVPNRLCGCTPCNQFVSYLLEAEVADPQCPGLALVHQDFHRCPGLCQASLQETRMTSVQSRGVGNQGAECMGAVLMQLCWLRKCVIKHCKS